MNYLWSGMILVGIIYGAFAGNLNEVTNAAINSAKEAVTLCITMVGIMAFWNGIMEIAKDAGVLDGMAVGLNGVINFLFPHIPKGHAARRHIVTNMIANMLGLGWAATPAGLKAMEALDDLEKERNPLGAGVTASNEMCTFLVLNISSLQIIPMTIIAYRTQYGSINPTAVIGPGLVATFFSTLFGIIFCKIMSRKK